MKIKPEIDNQGHQITQILYGAPMLESEAKGRQGARTDISQQIDQRSEKSKRHNGDLKQTFELRGMSNDLIRET